MDNLVELLDEEEEGMKVINICPHEEDNDLRVMKQYYPDQPGRSGGTPPSSALPRIQSIETLVRDTPVAKVTYPLVDNSDPLDVSELETEVSEPRHESRPLVNTDTPKKLSNDPWSFRYEARWLLDPYDSYGSPMHPLGHGSMGPVPPGPGLNGPLPYISPAPRGHAGYHLPQYPQPPTTTTQPGYVSQVDAPSDVATDSPVFGVTVWNLNQVYLHDKLPYI